MPASKEIRTLITALEQFKEIDPDITLPSILAFLYYAENDGEQGNQFAMEQWLDMSTATASRATSHWLKWKRPRVEGHDMLESIPDPEDRRYKMITLNDRGRWFVEKLKRAVRSVRVDFGATGGVR